MVKITKVVLGMLFLCGLLFAEEDLGKRGILGSMKESYYILPQEVDTLSDMFTEGLFYGRLRFNSFGFKWKEELDIGDRSVRKDHAIAAIGGSVIYKSAYLNGFAFTLAGYTTQSEGSLSPNEVYLYKGGKGLLSRYDTL